jgi:hypothetical protein
MTWQAELTESRVAKVVLISAVTPSVLQTDANPVGVPQAAFEGLQAALAAKKITVPILAMNGEADQIVPYKTSSSSRRPWVARRSPQLYVKGGCASDLDVGGSLKHEEGLTLRQGIGDGGFPDSVEPRQASFDFS